MAHPYKNHREMQVGHRRVKTLMKSGGYATDKSLAKAATGFARRVAKHENAEIAEEKHEGEYAAGGRIDKRARGGAMKHGPGCQCAACGGVQKRAQGGGIHQITPSKRKPHLNVNIVNVNHRPRRPPGLPALPTVGGIGAPALPVPPGPPGPPPAIGAGLPMRRLPGMAKGGRMRTGKRFGQGSGEGRLEEFEHYRRK